MTTRERADRLLVARGLFESRARAQAAIAAGLVTADGVPVRKASEAISSAAVITGVTGRICLDVGTSTGGFAEVLVLRGARHVYAIDVGRDQLHPRLRGRGDIVSMEETDIRTLDPARLAGAPDFATVDVSFISLKLVVPAVGNILKARATLVVLINPQFEAGRRDVKKGIVRDPAIHTAVCIDSANFLTELGWRIGGVAPSAIV